MTASTLPGPSASVQSCCPVFELRQYTVKPGQRETLIGIFDQHFVEGQEAEGMTIVGQFRDRRRDDRFVWLRGFADMTRRHTALERFYGGPVWAAHSAAARATMVDSANVLLLKPARPDLALRLDLRDRPAQGESRPASSVLAGIHALGQPADADLVARFEREIVPVLRTNGVRVDGLFVTESAANTFPRLPVREGEHVLMWVGAEVEPKPPATLPRPAREAGWLDQLATRVRVRGDRSVEILDLEPSPRSLFGHHRVAR